MMKLYSKRFVQISLGSLLLSLVVLMLSSVSTSANPASMPNASSSATSITFGEVASGSITIGETDIFTFTAYPQDVVLIRIGRTSGDLWPEILLYDSNNNLLDSDYAPGSTEITHTLPSPQYLIYLPLILNPGSMFNTMANADTSERVQPGSNSPQTYSIRVQDGFNGSLTGDYNLYIQRLNNPADAISASFGTTKAGSIDIPVNIDTYTFTGQKDDAVLVGVTASGFWPDIRLYDPQGDLLIQDHEPSHTEILYTLPQDGEYVVLIGDGFSFRLTGNYNRYIQRLNAPVNVTSFTYGNSLAGTIDSSAEMDTYQFSGGINDRVQITVSDSGFDLWPEVRLYSPTGEFIASDSDPSSAQIEVVLPGTGVYKILVCDGHLYNDTGDYNINLQLLP